MIGEGDEIKNKINAYRFPCDKIPSHVPHFCEDVPAMKIQI
jgi:hypothetical protein